MKSIKGLMLWVLACMATMLVGCAVDDSDAYEDAHEYQSADVMLNAAYEGVWTLNGQTLGTGYIQVGEMVRFTCFPFAALANFAFTTTLSANDKTSFGSALFTNDGSNGFGAELYKMGFSEEAVYDAFYKSNTAATTLLRTTVNGKAETCEMSMAVDWTSSNMVTDSRNGTLVCKLVVSSMTLTWQESKEEEKANGPYVLTFTSTRRI